MKKYFEFFITISFLLVYVASSQTTEPVFGIKFLGYVKTDILYDSRQIYELREGHFSIYPKNELIGTDGKDLNAKPSFNILSIQTRLAGTITGPSVLGGKSSAYFETEFFGMSDATINTLRLRHAFLKLEWNNFEILAGQYWHPMFVVKCYPGTIGFNTGAPFQPFIRSPQVRFTAKFSSIEFFLAALSQRDFQSQGPIGASTSYLRNAVLPNLHSQLQFNLFEKSLIGAGIDYKKLAPRTATSKNYSTNESIEGFSFIGFTKLSFEDFSFKAEGVYGENLTEMIMLSGYAVKLKDTATDIWSYTQSRVLSLWTDFAYGKDIEIGLFAGYSKNLGTNDNYIQFFGRGEDIADLIRVSPRIQFTFGRTKIAGEIEFTQAKYGIPNKNNKGKVENTKNVNNIRAQLALTYLF